MTSPTTPLGHHIMSFVTRLLHSLTDRPLFRKTQPQLRAAGTQIWRSYSDKQSTDVTSGQNQGHNQNQIVVQGTEEEDRLRVRRARPADTPRVLRFVKEHARTVWPNMPPGSRAAHLLLGDYVSRSLAQGLSMLAESQANHSGWTGLRGLALGAAVCPWDAALLERWARCVRQDSCRNLLAFTAHCLRAPQLHDKYRVHNILQVTMMVPPDHPRQAEIVTMLAQNAIKRGREAGFPLVRFDVSNEVVAKSLENMNFKKEWQLAYYLLPEERQQERQVQGARAYDTSGTTVMLGDATETLPNEYRNFISVYTTFTGDSQGPSLD